MIGQFLETLPSEATFQTAEVFGLMLILDVVIVFNFVRTEEAAKLALEFNVVDGLQMFPVQVERRTDELAAQLLTFESRRILSRSSIWGSTSPGATGGILCQVV